MKSDFYWIDFKNLIANLRDCGLGDYKKSIWYTYLCPEDKEYLVTGEEVDILKSNLQENNADFIFTKRNRILYNYLRHKHEHKMYRKTPNSIKFIRDDA